MSDPGIIRAPSIARGSDAAGGTPNGEAAAAATNVATRDGANVAPSFGATMRRLATIALWTIRVTGPLLVALGILFWTGRALTLLPLHMSLGLIFVIALILLGAIAARVRSHRMQAALAVALALTIPIVGIAQTRLFPGSWHWVVRVVHLLIGIGGMIVAARLARAIHGSARKRGTVCG